MLLEIVVSFKMAQPFNFKLFITVNDLIYTNFIDLLIATIISTFQ
jgi:hypothetical protein